MTLCLTLWYHFLLACTGTYVKITYGTGETSINGEWMDEKLAMVQATLFM